MNDATQTAMQERAGRQGGLLPPRPVQPQPEAEERGRPSATARALHFPAWIPFALSIAALVINQAGVALHALPPSTPVAVALIILTALAAMIAGVQALIVQYQAGQAELMQLNARLGLEEMTHAHLLRAAEAAMTQSSGIVRSDYPGAYDNAAG
jgi:hypothetical protein